MRNTSRGTELAAIRDTNLLMVFTEIMSKAVFLNKGSAEYT
jgi:hypothetical protein